MVVSPLGASPAGASPAGAPCMIQGGAAANNNQSLAARILGIERKNLYRKLHRLNLMGD